ncbi:hypothetical protein PIB30_074817 [Stylosanthes scabra]|uniref:Uncharacterized protein n=1 Tax=Stylosanthes scabra TaxID=79078 RepID=A0ABU6ZNI9_9FABA|nr:hypothetical protein [Stylosanthes scabra]
MAIKEKELQMKENELQTQRYIKEMEINAKEREMERMTKEREMEMDMQILIADMSTMSERRRALHEIACEKIIAKIVSLLACWVASTACTGNGKLSKSVEIVSCANNDINVLDCSRVFDDILNDRAKEVTFVKSISKPQRKKHKLFAQYQEGQRKDMERAF